MEAVTMNRLIRKLLEAYLKRIESTADYEHISQLSDLLGYYGERYFEEKCKRDYQTYLKAKGENNG